MLRFVRSISLIVLLADVVLAVQEPQVLPSDPLHHVVELELDSEGASIAATVDFEGTLFVWVSSEVCDPSLRIELAHSKSA